MTTFVTFAIGLVVGIILGWMLGLGATRILEKEGDESREWKHRKRRVVV